MSMSICPACGHAFRPDESSRAPDPSVVQWFRADPGWTGEASTEEVYRSYLRATDAQPVSREQFVEDLAHR